MWGGLEKSFETLRIFFFGDSNLGSFRIAFRLALIKSPLSMLPWLSKASKE